VVETVDAEDQGDAEGAEDLDVNPELGDPAITLAPVAFSPVWIASNATVTSRIVTWLVGSRLQPNRLCVKAVK